MAKSNVITMISRELDNGMTLLVAETSTEYQPGTPNHDPDYLEFWTWIKVPDVSAWMKVPFECADYEDAFAYADLLYAERGQETF